jgi:hypothetical protein
MLAGAMNELRNWGGSIEGAAKAIVFFAMDRQKYMYPFDFVKDVTHPSLIHVVAQRHVRFFERDLLPSQLRECVIDGRPAVGLISSDEAIEADMSRPTHRTDSIAS